MPTTAPIITIYSRVQRWASSPDLHELFADNDLILNSLYGFGDAIETGGYLIYTGQPWHPQLEMIARALTSHKAGSPNWVMRRRSQQEMDQLVEKAGF